MKHSRTSFTATVGAANIDDSTDVENAADDARDEADDREGEEERGGRLNVAAEMKEEAVGQGVKTGEEKVEMRLRRKEMDDRVCARSDEEVVR